MNLRKSLAWISLCVCAGCTTYKIPDQGIRVTPAVLKSNEQTYTVTDMPISERFGSTTTLTGKWHVVSADFIKDHVRNQDDLITALELVKTERKRFNYMAIGAVAGMLVLTLGLILRRR